MTIGVETSISAALYPAKDLNIDEVVSSMLTTSPLYSNNDQKESSLVIPLNDIL